IVIRAADPARRPRILYSGSTTNVFEVRASNVTIRGLEFGPTHPDADAIRIFNANGVTIEDCHFNHLGSLAVVANHASVRGLVVRGNVIRNSLATALYFGCHDGNGCSITGLLIEGNFIDGVTAPDSQIGNGLEDYKKRGLLRGVVVVNNTLYKNQTGAITAPENGVSGVVIVNNAGHGSLGSRTYPAAQTGLRLVGNVDCTAMACFSNPEQRDFSPHAASILRSAGTSWVAAWMPREDYFRARRSNPPT